MRKRMIGSLTVVGIALLFALPLQAQFIFVGGGVTVPTGDFEEQFDTGWMTTAGFGVDIGDSGFAAGVEGFYGQNNEVDDGEGEANPFGAMGFLLYRVGSPQRVGPYLFGGAGVLAADVSIGTAEGETETNFGYEFGAGLDFPFASRVGAWLEGRFMGSSDVNYFGILAGLGFGLGS